MPVPFGFSIGDFIAGIKFLAEVVKSLDETRGARADREELYRELLNLTNALDGIKEYCSDTAQAPETQAIQAVIVDCHRCIDDFVRRNTKYKGVGSTAEKKWDLETFKNGVRCVQWALFKKDATAKLRMEVQQHCNTAQMLLATLQVKQTTEHYPRIQAQYKEIDSKLGALQLQGHLSAVGATPTLGRFLQLLQDKDSYIRQLTARVQELESLTSMNQFIPPQVLLSSPVVLLDALGRSAPFHLEFIDSAEALIAVLKIRFKETGLHKIESGQFALEDTRRKKSLELSKPWTSLVRPGQHIGMSMVFRVADPPTTTCPGCGKVNEGSNTEDIQCTEITCRMTYRRIMDLDYDEVEATADTDSEIEPFAWSSKRIRRNNFVSETPVEDDIGIYTRVHLLVRKLEDDHDYITQWNGVLFPLSDWPLDYARPRRSILKNPIEKFPEDPDYFRESVEPLDMNTDLKGIPPNARWTRINRKLVNPEALDDMGVRYEEYPDYVIVLSILTKKEIDKFASYTRKIRGHRIRDEERDLQKQKQKLKPIQKERQTRKEKKPTVIDKRMQQNEEDLQLKPSLIRRKSGELVEPALKEPEVTFEETRPKIYQRRHAGRWAEMTDEGKSGELVKPALKEPEVTFEETRPKIYQRRHAGRWAQMPDE